MSPPSDTTTPVASSKSPGASPNKKKEEAEVVSKAMEFLISGKRNLLVQDVSGATRALEEACRLLGQQFGETGRECGEAYFYYGKALLEMARMESGVIENAFDGVKSDEEDNPNNDSKIGDPNDVTAGEAETISDQVDDALIENCESLEKKKEAEKCEKKNEAEKTSTTNGKVNGDHKKDGEEKKEEEQKKKDSEEDSKTEDDEEEAPEEEEEEEDEAEADAAPAEDAKDEEEKKETESIGSNDAGTSETKDGKDKDAVEKEEEEDPSNLQLSWEMLELSKSIFQKHADSIEDPKDEKRVELEKKLCEIYQLLGEVSIENENYEQSVEDLNSCLRRRQELLPSDSRSIAETHYQLGVALGFNLRFDDAVKALESSIDVLSSRVNNLKNKSESQDPSKKDDSFYTREKEIEEIEKLIPEIKEKIVDTRDMQEETRKKIKEEAFGPPPSSSSGELASSSSTANDKDKPVTNISSLVKKRKKSGEDLPNGDAPKKPHLEENGSSTNGVTNGGKESKTNGSSTPAASTA